MINLPLQCKIALKSQKDASVNIDTIILGSVQSIKGIEPNLLTESINIEYPMLTINELASIETILDSTKGSERLVYETKHWVIDDYTSMYGKPNSLTVLLTQVA